jgi:hypothetical protein
MRSSYFTSTACAVVSCVAFAIPVSCYAYDTSAHVYKHSRHATQTEISPKATALVPVWTTSPADADTNGLSRNRDDCNRGCIDN